MRNYLLAVLVCAGVTYLTTAPVRRFAIRHGVMTAVRDRDVHATPTPRLGGVAMLAGVCAGMLVASRLPFLGEVFDSTDARWYQQEWFALLSGAVLICLLGAIDDKWGLDAITKLAGQVLAATVMALQGVQLLWLPVGWTFTLTPSLGILVTVFVVVVTMNAVNFVDGLDGLAAGIVAIAACSLFVFSYLLSADAGVGLAGTPTLISALALGCCLGFLPHNFHPARVFMGDSGSMLLGLLLAASTVTLTGKVEPSAVQSVGLVPAAMPVLLPVLVLLVPFVDLVLAVLRRTRAGRSPFAPDKQHLHHRLLEIGHSHRRAVVIMYVWAALIATGILTGALAVSWWSRIAYAATVLVALGATLNLDRALRVRAGRLTS